MRAAQPAFHIEPVRTLVRGSAGAGARARYPADRISAGTRACRPPHHSACADGDVRLSRSGTLVIVRRPRLHSTHTGLSRTVLTERPTGAAQELHDLVVGVGQADDLTAHDDRTTARLERPVHDDRRPVMAPACGSSTSCAQIGSRPKVSHAHRRHYRFQARAARSSRRSTNSMRNRCNGTHGRWWVSSPWLRSSSFTLATAKPQPCSTVGWAGTANGQHRRQRGAEEARQVVGGGVAAEGACEGSLGEEFGEQAGESPVTGARQPAARSGASCERGRSVLAPDDVPLRARVHRGRGSAAHHRADARAYALATAVMGLRPAGPGHVQDLLLGGVRGHGASTSLCVRLSMGWSPGSRPQRP